MVCIHYILLVFSRSLQKYHVIEEIVVLITGKSATAVLIQPQTSWYVSHPANNITALEISSCLIWKASGADALTWHRCPRLLPSFSILLCAVIGDKRSTCDPHLQSSSLQTCSVAELSRHGFAVLCLNLRQERRQRKSADVVQRIELEIGALIGGTDQISIDLDCPRVTAAPRHTSSSLFPP